MNGCLFDLATYVTRTRRAKAAYQYIKQQQMFLRRLIYRADFLTVANRAARKFTFCPSRKRNKFLLYFFLFFIV